MSGLRKGFFSARNVAFTAILVALTLVLQAALGTVPIGVVELNFSLIPIVLGGIMFGPVVGAALGAVNGLVVLVQVITTGGGFYGVIWQYAPVVTALTCVVKTTVAGFVGGVVFKLLKGKNSKLALFAASACVPVVNTLLFVLGCLCMSNAIGVFSQSIGYEGANLLGFILAVLVTFNFFAELALNMALSPALYTVVSIVDGRVLKSKKGKTADFGKADGLEKNTDLDLKTENVDSLDVKE